MPSPPLPPLAWVGEPLAVRAARFFFDGGAWLWGASVVAALFLRTHLGQEGAGAATAAPAHDAAADGR